LLDEIKLMLRTVWMMIWGKNVRLVSKVEEHQRRIEGTQEELKDYLSQISDENLSEEDVDWKFIVLDYSQELVAIGTLIRRDLSDAAIRQIQLNQEPSPEDKEELEAFYARTLERIEKAAAMLMSREPRLAEEFIREKEQINDESRRARKTRLERPLSVQSASSNVVDMINCLRSINTLDRGRRRRYLRLWCYRQCLGDARAALRLGRVDDSSRLGCCRAVMPVLSSFLAGAVDLGNCHTLFYDSNAIDSSSRADKRKANGTMK
jgi:hypothetical protein